MTKPSQFFGWGGSFLFIGQAYNKIRTNEGRRRNVLPKMRKGNRAGQHLLQTLRGTGGRDSGSIFHLNAHRMVKCVGVGMVVLAAIVMIFTFISYYRKPKAAAESAPPAVQEKDAQEKILELSNSVLLVNVYDREGNLAKSGSGFIAFDDETLVTNFHVIKDAYSIEIVDNTDYKYSVEGVEAYSVLKT